MSVCCDDNAICCCWCWMQTGTTSSTAMKSRSTWPEYASSSVARCSIQSPGSSAGDWVARRRRQHAIETPRPVRKSRLLWIRGYLVAARHLLWKCDTSTVRPVHDPGMWQCTLQCYILVLRWGALLHWLLFMRIVCLSSIGISTWGIYTASGVGTGGSGSSMNRGPRAPGAP